MRRSARAAAAAPALLLALLSPLRADELRERFDVFTLQLSGEVRNTLAADVDGDGLLDLLATHAVYDDAAHKVSKYASLFRQRPSGFERKADDVWELPPHAVAMDLGNAIPPAKDLELIVVGGDRIDAHPIVDGRIVREPVPLGRNESLFNLPDWSAVRLWDFARDLDGDGADELLLFAETGTLIHKRGEDGRYALSQRLATPIKNKVTTYDEHEWLVDRIESFSVRFDRVIPNVTLREWNGDGRPDLVFAWNDEVQVHLGLGGGRFEERARPIDARVFSFEHMLRYSRDASILRTEVEDLSGDGLADVIVSRTAFANLEAENHVDIFYNKGGELVRDPHPRVRTDGLTIGPIVSDFNGDGRKDLLIWYVEMGIGTVVNYILLGKADIAHAFYLTDAEGRLPKAPSSILTSTFKFIPGKTTSASIAARRVGEDFDGDGRADLLLSGGPDSLLLYLNRGGEEPFDDAIELEVPASYFTDVRDLNADGRVDIVIRHEHRDPLSGEVQVLRSKPPAPAKAE